MVCIALKDRRVMDIPMTFEVAEQAFLRLHEVAGFKREEILFIVSGISAHDLIGYEVVDFEDAQPKC